MAPLALSMNAFESIDTLRAHGFLGFESVANLWRSRRSIPREIGVYLVVNLASGDPEFISPGVGGFFKGKNPNVSVEELKLNWVNNSPVVYIGKAGSPTGTATLHSRLGQYLRFGQEANIGHWGGRYIWQLANHQDLVIGWRPTPNDDPRQIEKELLAGFRGCFGTLPFANLAS